MMHGRGRHAGRSAALAIGAILLFAGVTKAWCTDGSGEPRVLCELEIGAITDARQRARVETTVALVHEHCLALVVQGDDAAPASTAVRVNGLSLTMSDLDENALDTQGWHAGFSRLLADARVATAWRLDLYLARTRDPHGGPAVDFTVCNMEPGRIFQGAFRLLLVEPVAIDGGLGQYWLVRQELVRQPIVDLHEAAVVGCALPERFGLPLADDAPPAAILAVVDDERGRVQAVLLAPVRP
ncbi:MULTISPECIES: hypothetical protein [unclassified Thiocapsa]|uniref:hypothetical protein n=1 Tax=unclassified Thiocapsa TaxID=2641286 RepID=UPI0035AE43AD